MSVNTVTPVEIAAFISGNNNKRKESERKKRAVKKEKEPLFGAPEAYYSVSGEAARPASYPTYGKNRKLV